MNRKGAIVLVIALTLVVVAVAYRPFGGTRLMSDTKTLSAGEVQSVYAEFDYQKHELTLEAFIQKMGEKGVVILDLRDRVQYEKGHIKNAVMFGADASEENLRKAIPDPQATVLIYCTNSFLPSRKMSLTLTITPQVYQLGYRNVFYLADFAGRIEDLQAKGLWSN
jgi:hypothetical protein